MPPRPTPLRLATDRACWRADLPVVPLLRPLLGEADRGAHATGWDRRFERYDAVAASHFELTSVQDAELVVLPGDWYWVRGTSWSSRRDRTLAADVRPLYERAREADKPVVMFFTGDRSCDRVPYEGVHVFREGGFASSSGAHDHPLPAFPEDLLAHYYGGAIVERPWHRRPTVGFCGLASTKPWWRRAVGNVAFQATVGLTERRLDPSPYSGELLRSRAIGLLATSPLVDTNFVLRERKVFFRDADARDLVDVRAEYVDNTAASDYVLCIRGSGNYSYRLYEAMAMGRVPIVVDTDLALPGNTDVAWRELTVWLEERDIDQVADRVAEFHGRRSPSELVDLQHELRRTWLERFAPEAFLARIGDRVIG